MSPVCCAVPTKWIKVGLFDRVFCRRSLPSFRIHLKNNNENAQSSGRRRTLGPPSRNLPNLDDARGGGKPGTPKAMSSVLVTKCRARALTASLSRYSSAVSVQVIARCLVLRD